MIPEAVLREVLAAGVPDMVTVHALLFLFPVLDHTLTSLLGAEAGPMDGARAVTALTPARGHGLVEGVRGHRAVPPIFFKIETITLPVVGSIH